MLVRQVLGAVAEFEKTTLVAKLAEAQAHGDWREGQGRKSHVETRPDVVALAKRLARKKPKGGALGSPGGSMRSGSGTNSDEPGVVTRSTKATTAFFGFVSFHDGSGSSAPMASASRP